jgi:predicted outer membrane repeat protein
MRRAATALAVIAFAGLLGAATTQAATYRVTRSGDPAPGACSRNHCSLREAVIAANASIAVADKVVLPNRRRAYRLTRPGSDEDGAMDGDLDVTNNRLAIVHRGRGRATIKATGLGERILETFEPTALKKLVLTGGRDDDDDGGAILAGSDLRIARSVLKRNYAADPDLSGPGTGGAIYHNAGDLRIARTKILNNRADDEAGAINATGDSLVLKRSTLRGNVAGDSRAGGIYSWNNLTRIDRTTFAGNSAPTTGGALYVNDGPVTVTNSTFAENRVTDSDGGAILSFGQLEVTNSTFWKNRATGNGGAIMNGGGGAAALNSVTIVRNVSNSDADPSGGAGGGVRNAPGAFIEVTNSIIAKNDQRGGDANDCAGLFTSLGGNLRTDGTDCSGFAGPGDVVRANPKIGKLRANGGPTQTIALKAGSPAIGRAVESLAPSRDQRGRRRDNNPDSGAFER